MLEEEIEKCKAALRHAGLTMNPTENIIGGIRNLAQVLFGTRYQLSEAKRRIKELELEKNKMAEDAYFWQQGCVASERRVHELEAARYAYASKMKSEGKRPFCEGCDHGVEFLFKDGEPDVVAGKVCEFCGGTGYKERRAKGK